jgi:leader peptidase (prepilin peptidase)/N-methyltransferase
MDAWQIAAVALGPFAGSFVATLVGRLEQGRPWALARSACASCGVRLAPRDLVPLLSFALARGRCRHCGVAIPRALPLAELAGLGLGLLAAVATPGPAALAGAVLGWWLWAAGWLDWRTTWLPHGLTWPLVALGLAASALGLTPAALPQAAIGALAGLVALTVLRLAWQRLRGREGLGAGDPPLTAAAGAWLGWAVLPPVLLAASLLGLAVAALCLRPGARLAASAELPFGSLLGLAAYAAWLVAMARG